MTTTLAETLRTAALAYARRGWRVIPLHGIAAGRCCCAKGAHCPTPGKHPLGERWQEHATTDAAQIRRWWHHRAEANVGLVTGGASGFFVLDVDPRHGGDETLAELERASGPLPETIVSLTGGGGRQYFFQHPGFAVPNSVGTLAPGLDVRGDGGLIVAPPSRHRSGRSYTFEVTAHPNAVALAPAPPWLLAQVRERTSDRLRADGTPLVLREGERNWRLYQLGSALRRYGVGPRALEACLTAINTAHCQPPLAADEMAKIAASAARYAPAPRCDACGAPLLAEKMSVGDALDEDALMARALGVVVR